MPEGALIELNTRPAQTGAQSIRISRRYARILSVTSHTCARAYIFTCAVSVQRLSECVKLLCLIKNWGIAYMTFTRLSIKETWDAKMWMYLDFRIIDNWSCRCLRKNISRISQSLSRSVKWNVYPRKSFDLVSDIHSWVVRKIYRALHHCLTL